MAQHRMEPSEVVFDDVTNRATLTFRATQHPSPPVIPGMTDWYPQDALTVTATVIVVPTTVTNYTCIVATLDGDGERVLTRYTFDGTDWVDPVLVDHRNQPIP